MSALRLTRDKNARDFQFTIGSIGRADATRYEDDTRPAGALSKN